MSTISGQTGTVIVKTGGPMGPKGLDGVGELTDVHANGALAVLNAAVIDFSTEFVVGAAGSTAQISLENLGLTERVQDIVAAFLVNGAHIGLAYNDVSNQLIVSVSGLASTDLSDFSEAVQDVVGAMATNGSGITSVYSDPAGTLTIGVDLAAEQERIDDRVAALLQNSAHISLSYDDPSGTLTIAVTGLASSDISDFAEAAQDQIGAHVKGTASQITATYDDAGTGDTTLALDTAAEAERIRDVIAAALVQGSNITITPNDPGDTITISSPGITTTVEEDDATVVAVVDHIDFGNGLDVSASPAGEANVAVDLSEYTGALLPKKVETLTDAATVTPSAANNGGKLLTLSQATQIANPSGSPTAFQQYILRIKSTTARALTWGTQFRSGADVLLPTTTTGGGLTDYFGFQWNSDDSKWDILSKVTGY
jgi:hypothetical protein